jgi:hypothetical protein
MNANALPIHCVVPDVLQLVLGLIPQQQKLIFQSLLQYRLCGEQVWVGQFVDQIFMNAKLLYSLRSPQN